MALQALRLQVAPSGIGRLGSSSSSSAGGAGERVGVGAACVGRREAGGVWSESPTVEAWAGVGSGASAWAADGLGSSAGVSSTSEWVPVVQGGMARNSSKVRTRGLQHFQPGVGWDGKFRR